jgi:uncharacterized protein YciI
MLFAIIAMLKPDAEAKLADLHDAFNEHLSQPFRRIRLAGRLCDPDRRLTGYLALVEAESADQAEAWLKQSPIFQAQLYESVNVGEYSIEVGSLD